jgi:NAD(P)-dependent dehydrogenase (short-subunit alcohol dehydrogenase family)
MAGFPGAHNGRVALVTGAATGLGRAFAERLARDGARVVAVDLNSCAETVDAIQQAGGEAQEETCDVTSVEAVQQLATRIDGEVGRCDIIVNNAGVARNIHFNELDHATWRQLLAINLDASFIVSKAFTDGMAERGFGRIINISSDTFGLVTPGFVHYIAAKGGVIGLTRGMATDLGEQGITVNCVLPGLTRTPTLEAMFGDSGVFEKMAQMQAVKRVAVPSDIEGTISFLASEDAAWVTGQSLVVDGGWLRH